MTSPFQGFRTSPTLTWGSFGIGAVTCLLTACYLQSLCFFLMFHVGQFAVRLRNDLSQTEKLPDNHCPWGITVRGQGIRSQEGIEMEIQEFSVKFPAGELLKECQGRRGWEDALKERLKSQRSTMLKGAYTVLCWHFCQVMWNIQHPFKNQM